MSFKNTMTKTPSGSSLGIKASPSGSSLATKDRSGSFTAPASSLASSKKNSKTKLAAQNDEEDDLDDIVDQMGEDFGFGFEDDQGDPNVKPKNLPSPESDPATRQSDAISLTWSPIGQLLTKLLVQGVVYNPKKTPFDDGFDPTKGVVIDIPDPAQAWCSTVSNLNPATLYVFRLVATNPAGTVNGPASAPFETVEFAPPRGDKSGFMLTVNLQSGAKTLSRKLSFKKDTTPSRLWYVLDGVVLAWFDKVDGKQLGSFHMKDVVNIDSEDAVEGSTSIVIHMSDKTAHNLVARSSRPDVTSAQYCKAWLTALRRAKDSVGGTFGSSTNTGMIF